MKTFHCSFKSVRVIHEERFTEDRSARKTRMEYDMNSVRDHHLEIPLAEILSDRSWKSSFFLTVMIVGGVLGLLYILLTITFRLTDAGSPAGYRSFFAAGGALLFLGLWPALSIPAAFARKKSEHVTATRGEGVWKLVDEGEWERFHRLSLAALKKKKPEA